MGASFTRFSGGPFWTLDGGPAAVAIAFAPFDRDATPSPLALAESWSTHPGTYVFLPAGTALDQAFAERLQSLLAARPGSARFAWIPHPGDPPSTWRASTLALEGGASVGVTGVPLRNLALWIGAGCSVALDPSRDAIVIAPPREVPGRVYLTGAAGAAAWSTDGAPVIIPFAGAQAGCLTSAMTLDTSAAGGDLDRLDVGLRIFTPDPGAPPLADRLTSWRFPVFRPGGRLPVRVSLDPLNPVSVGRTFLGLVPEGDSRGPELESCFLTTNGLSVSLTALADPPGALVPAVRALASSPAAHDPYYLVPSGAFSIRVLDGQGNEHGGPQRLACGISGVEYVMIEQPGSQIWFAPGGNALAAGRGLTGPATTAYASVFGLDGASLRYRAQPDAASVFGPTTTAGFLSFFELAGETLPSAPAEVPPGFPMLPFTGIVDTRVDPYRDVEYQAVAPTRRSIVGAISGERVSAADADTAATADTTVTAATPQGLLGEFSSGVLQALDLIRCKGGGHLVRIQDVSAPLVRALQSNQLFLVVSDPSALQTQPNPPVVDWTVTIPATADGSEQWEFKPGLTGEWRHTGTLLVFKFSGKALADLAADTTAWTQAETFNGGEEGISAAQQTLQAAIELARNQAAQHPEFQPFLELAADDAWQGVLLLNCPMSLAALPEQLAGLAAGIDQSKFASHHLGLTVTPVSSEGNGKLAQHDSSLFGLLSYESPTSAAGAPGPYAFVVDSLLVRFANSSVASFSSRIDLRVDELFGDPVKLTRSGENVIVLIGVYQQQGGACTYTFTTTEDSTFAARSAVLETVDVASAQFVTVTPPDPHDSTKRAESTFLLSGSLRFLAPRGDPSQAFDLFSYGPPASGADDPGWRLAYSNLRIELAYTPGVPALDLYTFDASKLAVDPAQSTPRAESLFASFPLTPSGFVHVPAQPASSSGSAATPANLGYLGVQAPVLQGALSAPWFGVLADLGLGTAGALASEVGFKASLLAAWAPGGGDTPNAAIGLKLPGASGSGGSLLSLESVLKLKLGELIFSRHDGTYLLQLDRIGLSVLMLTFPRGGQVDALLFADPTGKDHTTLGWYAGYAKDGGGS